MNTNLPKSLAWLLSFGLLLAAISSAMAWTHGLLSNRPVEYLLANTSVTILVNTGSKMRVQ